MPLDWVEEIFGEKKKEMKENYVLWEGLRSALSFACTFIPLAGQRLPRYARPRGIGSAVCKPSMRN